MKKKLRILVSRCFIPKQQLYLSIFVILSISPCFSYSQNITKGPYLVAPGSTKIIIRGEFDAQAKYVVNYGLNTRLTKKKAMNLRGVKGEGFLYEVTLNGLKPGRQYFYQLISDSEKSKTKCFKTFVEKQTAFHFVAMGDSRSNPDIFAKILNIMKKNEPDLIISMGDLVANGGNLLEWQTYYFDVARNVIDHIPLISTLGDHEGENDNGALFEYFLRTNQPVDKLWFSFDYGNAHFVSLDYRHSDSNEMEDWFIQDMSSSNARWKFVYFHRPAYNLGGHRSTWGRDKWPELFSTYQIDIVFAGHSHLYERFYPMQNKESGSWPVTYITTGGAGAGLYDVTQHPSLAIAESVNHFVDIFISGDTLKLKAICNDESLLDELTIIKEGDAYNLVYMALIQSQERVNLLTSFINAISSALDYIPFESYSAPHVITIKSCVNEDIPFRIELTKNSAQTYKMDAFSGILKAQEEMQVPLGIRSKVDLITISSWGAMTPELRLKMVYTYGSKEETIVSGKVRYWPSVY